MSLYLAAGLHLERGRANHKIGARDEWSAARNRLLEREQELGLLDEDLAKECMELPWVPVDKECTFDTEEGKTLVELFDQVPNGRDGDFPLRRHDEY